MVVLDGLARSFCQRFAFDSFSQSPVLGSHPLKNTRWLRWMPWLADLPKVCFHVFSYVSQMIALLDGLARLLPKDCCHFHLFPRWLLCWMAWPDNFRRLAFLSFRWSPRSFLIWLAWPHHFANNLLSWSVLCWMAWLGRFAKGVLSSLVIFYPRWVLCWVAWPDHFAKGLLTSFWRVSHLTALPDARLFMSFWFVSHDCFAMACPGHFAKGLLSCPFLCLPDHCFSGRLGQIISPKVCFHFFSCVSQMVALLDGLARLGQSFCHGFAFMCFHWSPR